MNPGGARILVFSFGGTKFQVGMLSPSGAYVGGPPVFWRSDPRFDAAAGSATRFVGAVAATLDAFLADHDGWADVDEVGFAFPGPCRDGRWFSNNLIPPFVDGVALEPMLTDALSRRAGRAIGARVVFDAQADAGGEVYHPRGRLVGHRAPAMVVNVATGIAAALVLDGRVLVGGDLAMDGFDAGAGQIGRHLWRDAGSGRWRYVFEAGGQTPSRPGGTRLTDRLSGPALAARLSRVCPVESKAIAGPGPWLDPPARTPLAAVRDAFRADSSATRRVLAWCTDTFPTAGGALRDQLDAFADAVAHDLVGALAAWTSVATWAPFGRTIVLTGGAGIHFLSRGAVDPWLSRLRRAMPGVRIERSRLFDATEREIQLFAAQ